MKPYMLDTNTASYLIRNYNPILTMRARERFRDGKISISSLTESELLFGIAYKPEATAVARSTHAFLANITVLPWDSIAAKTHAAFKAQTYREGIGLTIMDALIAAHALAIGAILVTSNKAFLHAGHLLKLEDWLN